MEDGTVILIVFGAILGVPLIGFVTYFFYFSSGVTQSIKPKYATNDIMTITTVVKFYDRKIKTYRTDCHYNDSDFDAKAKKDMELGQVYLERYKKYGTPS